jgi:hypothetical protein
MAGGANAAVAAMSVSAALLVALIFAQSAAFGDLRSGWSLEKMTPTAGEEARRNPKVRAGVLRESVLRGPAPWGIPCNGRPG